MVPDLTGRTLNSSVDVRTETELFDIIREQRIDKA